MKFESKMAQEAYDEMIALIQAMNEAIEDIRSLGEQDEIAYARLAADINARAIEVAAKIEIEEKRLEFEMNLKNPPMETIVSFPPGPRGGQDNDD